MKGSTASWERRRQVVYPIVSSSWKKFLLVSWSLSLLVLTFQPVTVIASITIVDTGQTFQSQPDKDVGLQMRRHHDYEGRLQRIPGNYFLCRDSYHRNQNWNITRPVDGKPVALLVNKGVCSDEQKAMAASKYIHPPGIVKFLIIEGDSNTENWPLEDETVMVKGKDNQKYDTTLQRQSQHQQNPFESDHTVARRTLNTNEHETYDPMSPWETEITVAVLHISYSVSYDLTRILNNEDDDTKRHGGVEIRLNDKLPRDKRGEFFFWIVFMSFVTVCFCCCLTTSSINAWIQEEQQGDGTNQPQRQRRGRLTPGQVGMKFPIYVFDGTKLVPLVPNDVTAIGGMDGIGTTNSNETDTLSMPPEAQQEQQQLEEHNVPTSCPIVEPHSLDACSICLDEYEVGDKLRCLPCQHMFHSKCIAKWLTERSATCPLCKDDLYEEEEEEEDDDEEEEGQVVGENTEVGNTIQQSGTLDEATAEESRERWWGRGFLWGRWGRNLISQQDMTPTGGATDLTSPLLSQEPQEETNQVSPSPTSSDGVGHASAMTQPHDAEPTLAAVSNQDEIV